MVKLTIANWDDSIVTWVVMQSTYRTRQSELWLNYYLNGDLFIMQENSN